MEASGIWENLCSPLALLKSLAQQSLLPVLGAGKHTLKSLSAPQLPPNSALSMASIRAEGQQNGPSKAVSLCLLLPTNPAQETLTEALEE